MSMHRNDTFNLFSYASPSSFQRIEEKKALEGRTQRRENTVTSSFRSRSPCTSRILVLHRRKCSMSRDRVAPAVPTVVIDHLPALPAELSPALGAKHVTTSSVLLDALRAIRAPLGLFLNGSQTLVLFLNSIFDADLIFGTGFVLVPWAIAGNASFGATVLAGADIRCAWTQDKGWSRIRLLILLCFDCGADASSDPAGPGGTFGLTQLDRIVFGACRAFVTCAALVNLSRLTLRSKTPAPSGGILGNVPALKVNVPVICCQYIGKRSIPSSTRKLTSRTSSSEPPSPHPFCSSSHRTVGTGCAE